MTQQLNSKDFPQGGFYILRHDDLYMIVDCAPADPKAPSGHKRNSRLSFELFAMKLDAAVNVKGWLVTENYL